MRVKSFLVALVLVAAAAVGLGFAWPFGRPVAELRLPGVVEVQEVRLGSKLGGRVAEVLVTEGAVVEANQVLVRFDVPEVRAQADQARARLTQAEADLLRARNGPRPQQVEAARATVEAARQRWERVKAGTRIEEVDQAQSELDSAEASLKLYQQEMTRTRRLAGTAASAQEYDTARARMDHAQGQVQAARAKLRLLRAGSREEDKNEAEAEWKRTRAELDLLLAGTRPEEVAAAEARVTEARGRVDELRATLAEAEVRAPERILVEVLAVRVGDLVPPNQPVLRVLRAADQWVKVYVPETQLSRLRLGQAVNVTVDGYPERAFRGTVMQIATASEFTPRNVQSADERRHQVFGVKVRVDDPEGVFKSGMAAEVTLPLSEAP